MPNVWPKENYKVKNWATSELAGKYGWFLGDAHSCGKSDVPNRCSESTLSQGPRPLGTRAFLRKAILYNLYSDNLNQMCVQKRHVFVLHIFSLCIFFERSTEACLGNYNIDLSDLLLVITSSDYSPARPQLDGLELIGSRLDISIAVTLSMRCCFRSLELSQKHFNYFYLIWVV